jgi:hypothetical protein
MRYGLIGLVLAVSMLAGCVDTPANPDFSHFQQDLHRSNSEYMDRQIRLLDTMRPQPSCGPVQVCNSWGQCQWWQVCR